MPNLTKLQQTRQELPKQIYKEVPDTENSSGFIRLTRPSQLPQQINYLFLRLMASGKEDKVIDKCFYIDSANLL
jgi:hypothetical protein